MNIAFYSRQQSFIDINTSTYGVLDIDRGGTGLSFVNTGDILYADGYNSLDTLSPSDDGYVLTLASGLPQWLPSGGGGTGVVSLGDAGRLALYPTTGTTVDDTYTQNANLIDVLIGPHLTLSYSRTYTIPDSTADAYFVMTEGDQSVSGIKFFNDELQLGITLDEIYGGTGKSSYNVGDILFADTTTTLDTLDIAADGYVLTTSSGLPVWESLADLTSATSIILNDESEAVIPANATWGFVLVGDNEEYAHFTVNNDASVINLINYSVNVSATDTDGFFVIYNNGSGLTFKNRLGSTKTVTYNLSNTAGATGGCCTGDIVCTSVFADGYGGGTKDPNAIIQMDSVTQGFLPPRMSTVQRLAIPLPPEGLVVYDLDLHKLTFHNGTSWVQI